ncbi:MAG: ABC transporter ATP-binding protein/permease [[Lactobacillus] timonensis]|jgi:ATP-binding cassette subfamily B protein|uniref:ABC transporter ATP-binding protein n=1 Tax=[Lactobacillus] timonensis TaxID=1970790 RepID=UPI0023577ABF|nr:ABC transporter ATP-binding protein [[Lactobacillus] timonensis]MCI1926461.1 ABC transporter ATP-binding protein/permease [[Lactobacillus] timonensis]MCI1957862.1 ABC transporter ATP-binding protein/permease [[Lactobacillus] timonensis]
MIKIARRFLNWWAALAALLLMGVQVSCDLYLPTVTANLIDKGIMQKDLNYVWHIGGVMLLVAFLGLLAAVGNVFFASTQGMKVGERIRNTIYQRVLYFSTNEIARFSVSSLITRSTNDIVQIQNVMLQMMRMMLQSPIMLVGACVMAYSREPRLTRVLAISLPVLIIAVVVVMYFAMPYFRVMQQKVDNINRVFREGLTGVRVIRAFNQDQREQDRFRQVNEDYTRVGFRAFTLMSFMFPIMTLVLSMTNVGIIWYGGHLIAGHSMQVGNLITFMTYANQILMSFMMLSFIFFFIPRAQVSAKRVNAVLDQPISVSDLPVDELEPLKKSQVASLEFKDVDFRYEGAQHLALSDLNFRVTAGQTLAIIGGTGSGKSTLVNLIPRLFDIERGQILVNGQDIAKISQHDLHSLISITQQKAVLFSGTVRSNLAFGNSTATDEQMWRALEVAKAADFVREQGGLDMKVEQDGSNFSGGQRQRLAIARTIIKQASVYVFDDSFSALDFKTDAQLRLSLKDDALVSQAVTVIVAQRISTVADADLILVLDDGQVVGQGTHEELAARNPVYQEIINSQLQEGDGGHEA